MTSESRRTRIRVGVFLAFGLLATSLTIFAIGEERGLFQGKVTLHADFNNVNGLVVGAAVRLAGLNVGTVGGIEFPKDIAERHARVRLNVESRYVSRIRGDSEAFIDSKGLLGDKIINVTLGSPAAVAVKDGDKLKTRTALTVEDLAGRLDQAASSVTELSRTSEDVLRNLATEEVQKDFGRAMAATASILESVEKGEGLAGKLLTDPEYATELRGVITETRGAVAIAKSAIGRVDRLLGAAEKDDKSLSRLILGPDGREAMVALRESSGHLASILGEVRNGDGLAHAILYDPEQVRMLDELGEFAASLNRVASNVEKGRGTVGGLMVDPSVYEDMKTILGNVERNVLLKALMRYTIKEGDIERPATVPRGVSASR